MPTYQKNALASGATITKAALDNMEAGIALGVAAGAVVLGERQVFCSVFGNDANDGLSWATAVQTIAKAKQVLDVSNGTIWLGAGNFPCSPGVLSLRATQRIVGVTRQGSDGGGSCIVLTGSGTLMNLDQQTNPGLFHLTLAFASSSVTGKLLSLDNAFTSTFFDVAFRGNATGSTGTPGQIGVSLTSNAGDHKFIACEHDLLGTGVENDSTISAWIACNWTSCKTAFRGGDVTGASRRAGAFISGGTMRGRGDYYIDAGGTSYSWDVDGVFFDGQATTAVRIGNIVNGTGYGPWSFAIGSPFFSGSQVSVELNACLVTTFKPGSFWGDSYDNGQHPNELKVNGTAAMLPRGALYSYLNVQGNDLGARLPSSGWSKF